MKEVNIRMIIKDMEEEIQLKTLFNDDDWEVINDFSTYTKELFDSRLIKEGIKCNMNFSFNKNKGLTGSVVLPDWEKVIVFLHKYRPFGLQNEPTYFYKVANKLFKYFDDSYIRSFIKEQRDVFNGKNMQKQIIIKINKEIIVNSEKMLDKWLNAYEYHKDKEKQKFIKKLNEILPQEFCQGIFVSLLINKAKAIYNLCSLIDIILGKAKEFNISIK